MFFYNSEFPFWNWEYNLIFRFLNKNFIDTIVDLRAVLRNNMEWSFVYFVQFPPSGNILENYVYIVNRILTFIQSIIIIQSSPVSFVFISVCNQFYTICHMNRFVFPSQQFSEAKWSYENTVYVKY